jgi:hypothetical protein
MLSQVISAALIVGGTACVINGIFGKSLINDVEMPLSQEEIDNPRKTTRWQRVTYIIFALFLIGFGIFRLTH